MQGITNSIYKIVVFLSLAVLIILPSLVVASAADTPVSQPTFLFYQLQTGSSASASSEFVSIVNASTKPQRLQGLCVYYSAATSDSWLERACFTDPDAYTQLWVVSGGAVYVASDTFITENLSFIRDEVLSSSMASSGGALLLKQGDDELDMLGWGTSNFSETAPAKAPSNSELLERTIQNGALVDTDDNSLDFSIATQGITAQSGVFEVELPKDLCENIDGMQEILPIGYEQVENECYQDVCLNIDGVQISEEGYDVDVNGVCTAIVLEDSTLLITELLPNVSGVDDGNEFIELYNPNTFDLNLKGYVIVAGSQSFIFDDITLGPKTYVTISDSESGIVLPNTTGIEVIVITPSGREVSRSAVYANAPDDYSWITIDNQWQFTNQPTPGAGNMVSISSSDGDVSVDEELAPCPEGKFRNPLTNRCKTIESDSELTPCDVDEFRNPLTNRCNKVSSSTNSLVPCRPGQERNPETNRCRNIATSSVLEPCPEGKERNPETNRCRSVAVLGSSTSDPSGLALTATIVDVPAPNTGVNWSILSLAILGSLGYIMYEWREEFGRSIASIRSYRYN